MENISLWGIHGKERNTFLDPSNPHIGLGWSDLGDITRITSKDELRQRFIATYGIKGSNAQNVGQNYRFVCEAQVGDYVLYTKESTMHIGRITSDSYYAPDFKNYKTVRNVEWLYHFPRGAVSLKARNEADSAMSFYRIDRYYDEFLTLLNDKPFFNTNLFQYIMIAEEIEPTKHDGSYILVPKVVKAFEEVDDSDLSVEDLDAIYLSAIGTWKASFEVKKQKIAKTHLSETKKQDLYALIDDLEIKAKNGEFSNSQDGNIGMFGSGFMSFSRSFNSEESRLALVNLIKMFIKVVDNDNEQDLFNIVAQSMNAPIKGVRTGSLSIILHCLKPTVFPILNGSNAGNSISTYTAMGIGITETNEIEVYIDNTKLVKEFRDKYCKFKNYRVIDLVPKTLLPTFSEGTSTEGIINNEELSITNPEIIEETSSYEAYTKEDFLREVYIEYDTDKENQTGYDRLAALLYSKKNIILQGAPGVGKTFAAKRLAYSIIGAKDDSRIRFVQFHQNYSYEDFIMGYKPDGNGFKLETGIFYDFCKEADENLKDKSNPKDKPYFFIIDEINRGNMSKIFGELLMLIEKDYRKETAILAYNKKPFNVPENVYIIGMMNTADRSLAMIDYALRRRFGFYKFKPAFESKGFIKYQNGLNNSKFDRLIATVIELNKAIANDESLGEGFCIGHSYFCKKQEDVDDIDVWLNNIVEYDLIPMLEEYWFDNSAKLQSWKNKLRGALNDNLQDNSD